MQARIKQTAITVPGVMEAPQSLARAAEQSGVSKKTLDLVHLRAGQINGCSVCVDVGLRIKEGRRTRQTNACSRSLDSVVDNSACEALISQLPAELQLSNAFHNVCRVRHGRGRARFGRHVI